MHPVSWKSLEEEIFVFICVFVCLFFNGKKEGIHTDSKERKIRLIYMIGTHSLSKSILEGGQLYTSPPFWYEKKKNRKVCNMHITSVWGV